LDGLTFLQRRNPLGELPEEVFEGIRPGEEKPPGVDKISSDGRRHRRASWNRLRMRAS
jgi:hypothetical protein